MELEPDVVAEAVNAIRAAAAAVVVPEVSVGVGLWSRAKALERSCYEGDETIEAARFFRRDVFERFGGYDERLTGPEDWELAARVAAAETVGRTAARIIHHEGRLTLAGLARKKFYYGRSFARYIRLEPQLAKRQLTPMRPAFVHHRRRLAKTPLLMLAMVAMKIVEFGAGGAGLVSEAARERLRKPRQRITSHS
jgi:GT2 family glycosyltransferase